MATAVPVQAAAPPAQRTLSRLQGVQMSDLNLITTLGIGSYGVVKLVEHKATKTPMALKILSKAFLTARRQQRQVMRESRVYHTVDYLMIGHLYGSFQDKDHLYMVMEYLPGGELFSLLYEDWSPLTAGDGGMPVGAARFYAACAVLSLGYLHGQDTAYRDLKMENLVLDSRGYAKLVDLGFAKTLPGDTRTYTKCGSPDYMAPECHFGKAHGRPVDLWSLGVLLFEMMTGTTPFFDEDRQNIVRNAINCRIKWPEGFKAKHAECHDLITKLVVVDPFKRLGTKKDSTSDME